jgi:proteasome lid subunit RPN8/RPN11
MLDSLVITKEHLDLMFTHLWKCMPEEGCGFLGGVAGHIHQVLPVENQLHDPERYMMEPMAQFRAMRELEDLNLEILAIYHSHPGGETVPSKIDIQEHHYPGVCQVILSRKDLDWKIRTFRLNGDKADEISLSIIRIPNV